MPTVSHKPDSFASLPMNRLFVAKRQRSWRVAVHFCSTQCKDEYRARLFAPEAPVKGVAVQRAVPAEVVVERTVPETESVVTKTRKVRRKKRAA
jgi:hypothetical protein